MGGDFRLTSLLKQSIALGTGRKLASLFTDAFCPFCQLLRERHQFFAPRHIRPLDISPCLDHASREGKKWQSLLSSDDERAAFILRLISHLQEHGFHVGKAKRFLAPSLVFSEDVKLSQCNLIP